MLHLYNSTSRKPVLEESCHSTMEKTVQAYTRDSLVAIAKANQKEAGTVKDLHQGAFVAFFVVMLCLPAFFEPTGDL